MSKSILIIGGYGSVGKQIAQQLAPLFSDQVIVAGRSLEQASALAARLGYGVRPLALDIEKPFNDTVLDDVHLVIMCVDQRNAAFLERCISKGVHYVDISASYALLRQFEQLHCYAKAYHSTVALSVGVAPGMTNLLASHSANHFDTLEEVDMFVLLGLGESHGEASLRWLMDNLRAPFIIRDDHSDRHLLAFHEGKKIFFPFGIGERKAYRFDFSDQHVLPRTLGLNSASTWLCFEPPWLSRAIALGSRLGLTSMLEYKPIYDAVLNTLRRVQTGSDQFVLKALATGTVSGARTEHACWIRGYGDARATGIMAAEVATHILFDSLPHGVFHIEQLFHPLQFIEGLKEHGLEFGEAPRRQDVPPFE